MLNGIEYPVQIGECTRYERGRLSVFFDGYPMQEFMETGDGDNWAGLVKPNGKKTVAAESALPPLYRGVRLAPYQQATGQGGSGRPTGLAVIIGRDDVKSAVHHAAARQLGKLGLPLEPA